MSKFYSVAVPTPLRRTFDYLAPAENAQLIKPGSRVVVPFGRQSVVGVVTAINATASVDEAKLKAISTVLDQFPVLDSQALSLCFWASEYYQHPIGETLMAALPVELRKATPVRLPTEPLWQHTNEGKGLSEEALKRSKKQQKLHQLLLKHRQLSNNQLRQFGLSTAIANALMEKGLVELTDSLHQTKALEVLAQANQTPTAEQQQALDQLRYHHYATYLLEGATGSGKTEVYMQAVTRVLNEGKQALVLVPEIGLTPQTLARFKERFAVPVVELHSNVAQKLRTKHWLMAALGQAQVVIGTRLAAFTPMPKLGLIIIDEEHDLSFKQQDGLRYSARDIAVLRAHRQKIPLILGSATPSLESLQNAIHGRYEHLRLTQRAGNAKPPVLHTIDMRKTEKLGPFSVAAMESIQATLKRGEQALIFINRRGYAPALLCEQCGWVASCHACDARLTLHQNPKHLHCHHCDAQKPVPLKCPSCLNGQLNAVGQGTERVEELLENYITQGPIIRVDQDSMQRKNAMQELTNQMQQGEPCVLVGTQMLAKGHHFPKVTLVVMLDVDQALFSGDFRALERLGQQVTQVAGRAGRASSPGTVLLQSYQTDHPLLVQLLERGYHRYARTLLAERQSANLPPYWYMVLLRAESKRAQNAQEFLQLAANLIRKDFLNASLKLLGPLPSLIEKRQDRYRYQLQITSANRPQLQKLLKTIVPQLENHALARRTRWSIDVDPGDTS